MKYIGDTPVGDRFLLQPRHYTHTYNSIKSELSPDLMRLFAKPELFQTHISWTVDASPGADVLDYLHLQNHEKEQINQQITSLRDEILAKLPNTYDFREVRAELFKIPSLESIKVIRENDIVFPVLLQWACASKSSSSDSDPIGTIIRVSIPKKEGVLVELKVLYDNHTPAANDTFELEYLGRVSTITTNEQGIYIRGDQKIHSKLIIRQRINDKVYGESQIEIVENKSIYELIFPYLKRCTLFVFDQYGDALENRKFVIINDQQSIQVDTGKDGIAQIGYLSPGSVLKIFPESDESNFKNYTVSNSDNRFEFELAVIRNFQPTLVVTDPSGQGLPNEDLNIIINEISYLFTTDGDGVIQLPEYPERTVLKISHPRLPNGSETINLVGNKQEYRIILHAPEKNLVKLIFVDKHERPLAHTKVKIDLLSGPVTLLTDEFGLICMTKDKFKGSKRTKLDIDITKEELKRREKRNKYNEQSDSFAEQKKQDVSSSGKQHHSNTNLTSTEERSETEENQLQHDSDARQFPDDADSLQKDRDNPVDKKQSLDREE